MPLTLARTDNRIVVVGFPAVASTGQPVGREHTSYQQLVGTPRDAVQVLFQPSMPWARVHLPGLCPAVGWMAELSLAPGAPFWTVLSCSPVALDLALAHNWRRVLHLLVDVAYQHLLRSRPSVWSGLAPERVMELCSIANIANVLRFPRPGTASRSVLTPTTVFGGAGHARDPLGTFVRLASETTKEVGQWEWRDLELSAWWQRMASPTCCASRVLGPLVGPC